MNHSDTPATPDAACELFAALHARGMHSAGALSAVREVHTLATSEAPASAVSRAVGLLPCGVEVSAPLQLASEWIRKLTDAINQAIADGCAVVQPAPQVIGLRRSADADRFRVDGVVGSVALRFECERLPHAKGWRLVGTVESADPLPPALHVRLVNASGDDLRVPIDDLAMFECTVARGEYACSLQVGAHSTPTLLEFSAP